MTTNTKRPETFRVRALALAIALAAAPGAHAASSLTIFHNNDGESKLFGDADFGGVAFFKTTLDNRRAANAGRDQLTISSGDNVLAGLAFNASIASGPLGARTYYDALALQQIGYDAITLGNHDFDFGPAVLADFISFYDANGGTAPFLSANLDFTGEAALQAHVAAGNIASSTVVTRGANTYGIIGVTTETLADVSSPGAVGINPVLGAIQAEVASLQGMGVNKIILSSHLQAITNEFGLVGQLSGVDVVIAGGGDELLLNSDNVRNTAAQASGPYPTIVSDADGRNVAVVTTVGEYLYVGELNVEFDDDGAVVNVSGDPVVVDKSTASSPLGVLADPTMQSTVIAPLNLAIAAANANVVATTDVFLEHSLGGTSGPRVIRQQETNLGDLIADAFVWAVTNEGTGLTSGNALIGLTNSGGIREDLDNNQDGFITQGEAVATLPFNNTMAVLGGVNVTTLKAALENAVSRIQPNGTGADGRFAQISGFEFDYDRNRNVGDRVVEIRFDDDSLIWNLEMGAAFVGQFDIATNSFLAGPGTPDGYNFGAVDRTILSTGYADALLGYLTSELNGQVLAANYPLATQGRINAVPAPAAAALLLGAAAFGLLRRRRTLGA